MKPLTFKESKQLLFAPIIENNPIALQILGICSALAVTVKMDVTLVMCAALTSVVALSNFLHITLKILHSRKHKNHCSNDCDCFFSDNC